MANGRSQQFGVDCYDTFSPIVKPVTIRMILSLALSRNCPIHQLDVKNAFLYGDLPETVYMYQPPGYAYRKYALELLDMAHMANCKPTRTPVDMESKLSSIGDLISDPTLYRSLTGCLQYLTFTRPDISYVVQQVCLHMHDPQEPHLVALKRVLRYVRGTLDFGLQLYAFITGSLIAYIDADWASCPTTSVSAIYMTAKPIQHQRTKHIEIDIHFVSEMVARGQVRVLHVPSRYQYADILPKDYCLRFLRNFVPV
ncbi:ribonuclease H-like domain-containing protein [Tanacetum coccineum]